MPRGRRARLLGCRRRNIVTAAAAAASAASPMFGSPQAGSGFENGAYGNALERLLRDLKVEAG
jgi:hypothetical protein